METICDVERHYTYTDRMQMDEGVSRIRKDLLRLCGAATCESDILKIEPVIENEPFRTWQITSRK